ncbi:MAG: type VI secretion system protein TssA [bacterium]
MLDVNTLTAPLSGHSACGEDLEYDPLFAEMERAKAGTPDKEIGGVTKEGEPPDWQTVKKHALKLAKKTRDVRLGVNISLALLQTEGFGGFSKGVALIYGLFEKSSACLYPEHDPYDEYPMEQMNALKELSHFDFQQTLKKQALVKARGLGEFSLFDIEQARENTNSKEGVPSLSLIDAAFKASEERVLTESAKALGDAINHFKQLTQLLNDKIGSAYTPDFSATNKMLQEIQQYVLARSTNRQAAAAVTTTTNTVNNNAATNQPATASVTAAPVVKVREEIESREDVVKALEKISKYYTQHEPGSPIPLLLDRAKRLVDKSFVEVIEDLSPASSKEMIKVLGVQEKKPDRRR